MFRYIFFLILILSINFFDNFFYKQTSIEKSKTIFIGVGMGLDEISNLLYSNKIIHNKLAFKIWVKINSYEKKLKFGEYDFDGFLTIPKVSKKLLLGESIYRKLTIIEGSSKYDFLNTLKKIDKKSKITVTKIPDNIIADTYTYQLTDNAEKIVKDIYKLSSNQAELMWKNRDFNVLLKDMSEMFTLASIVEKETHNKKEKKIVAGVFFNRLEKKMRLQSDPTVEFSITKGKEKLGRNLKKSDLKFNSEYNTYKNHGFPPSPICFPGLDSLNSVVNPMKTNFLYFVANKLNQGHLFSPNYDGHLKNIRDLKRLKKK